MGLPFRAAARTAALCFCLATPVLAQDATLTSRGGGLSVSGRLVGYDGLVYRIDTDWGRLTVDAAAVDCAGPGCPDLTRFAPELRVAAEPWLADRLLVPLIHRFARAEGLTVAGVAPHLTLLSQGDKPELHIRLRPLAGPAAPVLAAGDADAALAAADRSGRLIAQLPLVPVSAEDAPTGPLALDSLRRQRRNGGGWDMATGGEDRPLIWHGLPAGSSLDRATSAALGALHTEAMRWSDPAELTAALRRDPWGLALLPMPLAERLVPRDIRQTCGLAADLSDFAAAAGDHPLLMPVSWIETGRRLAPVARALADHLATPSAQAALHVAGAAAPSATQRQPLRAASARLFNTLADRNPEIALADRQAALALLSGAERLAVTFRLDPRTDALDAAGRSTLAQLSAHLATGTFHGRELLLVGFTDSSGPADRNLAAGLARAEALRKALIATTPDLPDGTAIRAASLGEAMPIACDDTAEGRRMNRRVEVWLHPAP